MPESKKQQQIRSTFPGALCLKPSKAWQVVVKEEMLGCIWEEAKIQHRPQVLCPFLHHRQRTAGPLLDQVEPEGTERCLLRSDWFESLGNPEDDIWGRKTFFSQVSSDDLQ